MDSKQIFHIRTILILEKINRQIRLGHTGGQTEFAKKMRMDPTTLGRKLTQLETLGAIIAYDRSLNTYYYLNNFNLHLDISYD